MVVYQSARYPCLLANLVDGKTGHAAFAETGNSRSDQFSRVS